MATNKRSFVLYTDLIHTVEKLSDADAGELFKHILRYVNDLSPETKNQLVDIVFEPIKQQLKRDLKHWESIINKRKVAGAKGGKQKLANASKRVANVAVSVNDSVSVSVTDNVNDIKYYKIFKHLKLTFDDFDKLVRLGYSVEQINKVLESIENYKKNTNYTSLYLTAKKWLEKETKQPSKLQNFLNNYEIAKNL